MKASELKKVLKPLIKECIREAIFEEGVLSKLIQETIIGTTAADIVLEEAKKRKQETTHINERKEANAETRKKLLNSIGSQKFGGIDVFENTTPIQENSGRNGPLANQDSGDPGVDISNLPGMKNWGKVSKVL